MYPFWCRLVKDLDLALVFFRGEARRYELAGPGCWRRASSPGFVGSGGGLGCIVAPEHGVGFSGAQAMRSEGWSQGTKREVGIGTGSRGGYDGGGIKADEEEAGADWEDW